MPIANKNKPSTISRALTLGKQVINAATKNSKMPIAQSVGELIQQADTPKASKAEDMVKDSVDAGSKIMSIAGKALKYALPIAKVALSLNDDEWFDEYKASGATFAETLQLNQDVGKTDDGNKVAVESYVPSLVEIATDFCDYGNNTADFYNAFMPSILSYVRKKTNNVLIEETWKYDVAFVSTVRLYALYYTLRKYEKLALNVPINMPTLPLGVPAIEAKVFNQMIGIADSLEGYLKSTCGLPHALAEYLRWRYGTIFHSDNTGRPALITYDPFVHQVADQLEKADEPGMIFDAVYNNYIPWVRIIKNYNDEFIPALSHTIAKLQTSIQVTGRAISDLCLAYKDHQIKYDVNDATYDAKEYNLRCNLTSPSKIITHKDAATVILDSRLDQSAALQAVTCSSSYLPWEPTEDAKDLAVGYYQGVVGRTEINTTIDGNNVTMFVPRMDPYNNNYHSKVQPPFFVSDVIFVILDTYHIVDEPPVCHDTRNDFRFMMATHGNRNNFAWISALATRAYVVADADGILVDIIETNRPRDWDAYNLGYSVIENVPMMAYSTKYRKTLQDDLACDAVDGCLAAVQMHNQTLADKPVMNRDTLVIRDHTSLAYDTATINTSQVKALHTMFIRNLTRGEYKSKSSDAINEAKDSVAELAKDVLA
jgi:hypothetical protein